MSKRGSSSMQKEKSKDEKKWDRSPRRRREETKIDLHGGTKKTEIDLQREEVTSGTAWAHPSPSYSCGTHSVSQVLYEVQHEKFLRLSSQMKTNPTKRDITKYCEFHRDHGHRTDDCIQLKKEIEFLIRRGNLGRYLDPKDRNQAPSPPPRKLALTRHQQPLGEINVISEGFVGGGESSSARKANLRSIISGETLEVQAASKLPRLDTTITFSDSDYDAPIQGCPVDHPSTRGIPLSHIKRLINE